MSDYYESEIEPIWGNEEIKNNQKTYKPVKMQCNNLDCRKIGYTLTCRECGAAMFKYRNPFV